MKKWQASYKNAGYPWGALVTRGRPSVHPITLVDYITVLMKSLYSFIVQAHLVNVKMESSSLKWSTLQPNLQVYDLVEYALGCYLILAAYFIQ
jgi:hypothetical protein